MSTLDNLEGHVDAIELARMLLREVQSCKQRRDSEDVHGPRSEPTDSFIRVLDELILKSFTVVRRILNDSSPIHRLPQEVLSYIFLLVPRRGDDDDKLKSILPEISGPSTVFPVRDLFPIVLVCRRWRTVVLNTPLLLGTIEDNVRNQKGINPLWGSRQLPTQAPLFVRLKHGAQPRTMVFLKKKGGTRVREFHFDGCIDDVCDSARFRADALRFCKLVFSSSHSYSGGAILPLFRNHTPELRVLFLRGIYLLPSNQFPSLTQLILNHDTFTSGISPFTFDQFFDFISRCPNIERLHLSSLDGCFFRKLETVRDKPPLSLDRLKIISIDEHMRIDHREGGGWPMVYYGPEFRYAILRSLSLPASCLVRISTVRPRDLQDTVNMLGAHTSSALTCLRVSGWGRDCRQKLPYMRMEELEEGFSLQLVNRPHHPSGVRIDCQMPGKAYTSEKEEDVRASLCDILARSPLYADVRALWVTYDASTLVARPPSILQSFPHLTMLSLFLDTCGRQDDSELEPLAAERVDMFSALPMQPEIADGADVLSCLQPLLDVWPCPELRTLVVYMRTSLQAKALVSVLRTRVEAGMALVERLVVVYLNKVEVGVHEYLAEAATPYVQHVTVVDTMRGVPSDVFWGRKVPSECYEYSKLHKFWPAWL